MPCKRLFDNYDKGLPTCLLANALPLISCLRAGAFNILSIAGTRVFMDARAAHGAVAQLGERYVRNVQVGGSIPLCSTIDSQFRAPTVAPCFVGKK